MEEISNKLVTSLRKAGKLHQAHEVAIKCLELEPDNIKYRRAYAWVLYDWLKYHIAQNDYEQCLYVLNTIPKLHLEEDEALHTQVGWATLKLLKTRCRTRQPNIEQVLEVIGFLKDMPYGKPSELHSAIFEIILQMREKLPNFLEIADDWGLKSLRPEDYVSKEFDGQQRMSIGERAYMTYMREYLSQKNKEAVLNFLPEFEKVWEEHPEFHWLTPYYIQAHIFLDDLTVDFIDNVLVPYIRDNHNEYKVWIWGGNAYKKINPEFAVACYTKAIVCRAKPEILVGVRIELAKLLVQLGLLPEAAYEIKAAIQYLTSQGKPIPEELAAFYQSEWYKSTVINEDNRIFYSRQITIAEDILYQTVPWTPGCVVYLEDTQKTPKPAAIVAIQNQDIIETLRVPLSKFRGGQKHVRLGTTVQVRYERKEDNKFVVLAAQLRKGVPYDVIPEVIGILDNYNQEKRVAHFIVNQNIDGTFKPENFPGIDFQVGEIYAFRVNPRQKEGRIWYEVLAIRPSEGPVDENYFKSFQATLRIIRGKDFGFADSVFVPPDLIRRAHVFDGQPVKGLAIEGFDPKKQQSSWRAIRLLPG